MPRTRTERGLMATATAAAAVVVITAALCGCHGGRGTRTPDPAPVAITFEEVAALPVYLTNNAVTAVPLADGGWAVVTATGLGPGKSRDAITDTAWVLPVDDAEPRWRALDLPLGGGRLAGSMVAIGDDVYLVGGYEIARDDEESTIEDVERLVVPQPLPAPPDLEATKSSPNPEGAGDEDETADNDEDETADNDEASSDDETGDDDESGDDASGDDASGADASGDDEGSDDDPRPADDGETKPEPPAPAHKVPAKDPVGPKTGWTKLTKVPVPVDDTVAFGWRDQLVLVSGWSEDDTVDNVQVYDPANERWRAGTPLPGGGVFGHAGAVVGDTIVVCDGVRLRTRDELEDDPDPEPVRYTIVAGCHAGEITGDDPPDAELEIRWRALPPHPGAPRYRMAAGVIGPYVLFVGGTTRPYNYDGIGYDEEPATPSTEVFAWDTERERWWTLGTAPVATMDHRGLARVGHNGDDAALYLVGGMVGDQAVSSRVYRITLNPR